MSDQENHQNAAEVLAILARYEYSTEPLLNLVKKYYCLRCGQGGKKDDCYCHHEPTPLE